MLMVRRCTLIILLLVALIAAPQTADADFEAKFYPFSTPANELPNFSQMRATRVFRVPVLDFPDSSCHRDLFGQGAKVEQYGLVFSTRFNLAAAARYEFRVFSDDGARLVIDGKEVVIHDGVHPASSRVGTVHLSAGSHTARVEYFQGPCAGIALQVFWKGPDNTEVFFPLQPTASNMRVIPRLIERLKTERDTAGPRRANDPRPALIYSDEELAALRSSLEALRLSDSDWIYLIDQHFNASGWFDASQWDRFRDYSQRAKVEGNASVERRKLNNRFKEIFQLPQGAIDYLDQMFFHNQTVRNRTVSRYVNDSYGDFLIRELRIRDRTLRRKLDGRSLALLDESLPNSRPSDEPTIRALRPGEGRPDCSFNAVLQRLRAANPVFALHWDQYVVAYGPISGIPSGGGGGLATRRSRLIDVVRQAMKACERSR